MRGGREAREETSGEVVFRLQVMHGQMVCCSNENALPEMRHQRESGGKIGSTVAADWQRDTESEATMNGQLVLLTVKDVSERLGISRGSVYELVKQGRLGAHRVGSGRGTIRVSESDLRAYLEECRVGGDPVTPERRRASAGRRLKHISVGGK